MTHNSDTTIKAAKVTLDKAAMDSRPSGFRDWTYHQCWVFMVTWPELEAELAEQAALAATCELFNVSYMDTEWVKIIEAIANREDP